MKTTLVLEKLKLFLLGFVIVAVCVCASTLTAQTNYPKNNKVLYAMSKNGYATDADKTAKELRKLEDYANLKVSVKVFVDDDFIENDTNKYYLTVHNLTKDFRPAPIEMSNKFTIYLYYDTEYDIEITYKGCVTKQIHINTNAPHEDWFIATYFKLYRGEDKTLHAGDIKYNKKKQTFEAIVKS